MSLTKRAQLIRDLKLTERDVREISAAAYAVWNDVAYDLLQAVADEKGKDINAVTVSRAVVMEIVLDADRLADRLRPRSKTSPHPLSPAGQAVIANQYELGPARAILAIIVKDTFPYRTYGM